MDVSAMMGIYWKTICWWLCIIWCWCSILFLLRGKDVFSVVRIESIEDFFSRIYDSPSNDDSTCDPEKNFHYFPKVRSHLYNLW